MNWIGFHNDLVSGIVYITEEFMFLEDFPVLKIRKILIPPPPERNI
jgi:hypothetical protein